MTTEELLKPRYKVIADYPGMNVTGIKVGDILSLDKICEVEKSLLFGKPVWVSEKGMKICGEGFFKLYPHLFRKLEWWEERRPEDMPQYVKFIRSYHKSGKDEIRKVEKWGIGCFYCTDKETFLCSEKDILPATESEYNTHIRKTV